MMGPSSADIRCVHCDAALPPREIAEGWCDTCGKRLPSFVGSAAKGQSSPAAAPASAASGTSHLRSILWGVAALIVSGIAVAATAFARGG